MFGLLKRKAEPLGPFEFEHTIDIERPAADIYRLIDWADPGNAKRALGNKVEQVGQAPDRYRMVLDMLPDLVFEMTVTGAVRGERYAFETDITPPVGRLVSSSEAYNVAPLDANSCRLDLVITAWFVGGMSEEEIAMEVMMMGTAGQNGLRKLKVQAEEGVEAVHAIEAMQMDCFEDD